MGRWPRSLVCFAASCLIVVSIACLSSFIGGHCAAVAAAPATTVPVHVGVILNLATGLGKKSLLSMEMALEDLYGARPNFTTRVKLHVRDSNRDVVTAASAAIDVIDNERVSVVIGPQSTLQADFVTYLANKTKVPVITFSATGDTITHYNVPYFLRACVKDSFQVASIAAFIKAYGWKNVVLVYEDSIYGAGIIPSLTDSLQNVNAHVIYHCAIAASCTKDHIDMKLYKLMTMQTRVFIVHMLPACASRLFARASTAGMMTEGYVWIITDSIGNAIDVLHPQIIETMQGVVGFRPYVPKSRRISEFMAQYTTRFRAKYHQDPDVRMTKPTIFQYWAYDVAWAVATAAEEVKIVRSLNTSFQTLGNVGKKVDDLPTSPTGPELLSSLLKAKFDGLSGRFSLVDRQLEVPIYEIVNVVGEAVETITFWNPGDRDSSLLNSSTSEASLSRHGGEVLKPVVWPGDPKTVPRGWDFPVNEKILRIGVPRRHDFKNFVNVETDCSTNRSSISGYCIDIFDAAVKRLPYALRHEYIPFDCASSYDLLVSQVYSKNFDAAVGDVTIIANRTKYVDFTMPYTESGVSMLVLVENDNRSTMWIFIQPLTKELWFAIVGFFFFTGLVVWAIEAQKNPEFRGINWRQISNTFYFSFSTWTFSHDHIIKSLLSKIVVVIWCFVVLILVQSYTASLSSMLTAQRLQPSVTDLSELLHDGHYVGYQNGSFVFSLLKRLGFDERKIKVFSKQEEYAEALRKGSGSGGVSAIFDEVPYLQSFLSVHGKEFQMVGPKFNTDGFGFVFPIGSPLVPDLSKAILDLTEGDEGREIEEKWFGALNPTFGYSNPNTVSSALTLRSFSGLFIITGSVSFAMLLISIGRLIHARFTKGVHGSAENFVHPVQDGMAADDNPETNTDNNPLLAESLHIETNANDNPLPVEPLQAESLHIETNTDNNPLLAESLHIETNTNENPLPVEPLQAGTNTS